MSNRNVTRALAAHDDVSRVEAFILDPRAKPMLQAAALEGLAALGWRLAARADSPIAGGDGNREILLHAERRSP